MENQPLLFGEEKSTNTIQQQEEEDHVPLHSEGFNNFEGSSSGVVMYQQTQEEEFKERAPSESDNENVEKRIVELILKNYSAPVESFATMPDISKGDEEVHEMSCCVGLQFSWLWFFLFWLSVVLSLGLVLLFCYWYDWLKDRVQHNRLSVIFNERHENYLSRINADDDLRKNDIFKGTSFKNATAVFIKARETGQITICMIEKKTLKIDEKLYQVLNRFGKLSTDNEHTPLSKPIEVTISCFKYRNLIYIYNEESDRFDRAHHFTLFPFANIHTMAHTISSQFAFNAVSNNLKQMLFGTNSIKTEVRNIISLLLDEVLHPFYIFQVISVCVWLSENYYVYAVAIAVMSSISSLISMYETRTNMVKLKEMTTFNCGVSKLSQHDSIHQHYASNSKKKRSMLVSSSSEPVLSIDDAFSWKGISKHRVDSTELLPGDLIEIENGMVIPCDCVLLHGQTIMNESMLTGESTPTKKVPIPKSGTNNEKYNCMKDKTHTLFSGTQVILNKPTALYESSEEEIVCAMVIQTGFQTAKGKLVLSILYPKPNQFSFYSDSMKFLFMMFLFGIAGISYSLYNQSMKNAPLGEMIISCFDLLTTIVPPALPISMSVCVSMAISRLKKKGIFCISPPRINVSGRVNIACFDKTNTLTRDGLDLHCVVPIGPKGFEHLIKDNEMLNQLKHATNPLLQCMACCHNLSYVFGKLVGDPLDVKLFEATTWDLVESDKASADQNNKRASSTNSITISSPDKSTSFTILKIFDFKSSLQRMSVVAQNENTGDLHFFVKGSAEMLKTLSHSQTIPGDFEKILYKYAHKGYRVLGCASRVIKYKELLKILDKPESFGRSLTDPLIAKYTDQITREEVESKLDFLGLICMENKLKPETPSVIRTLTQANLRSVVITGDNPYTTICVARKCSMLPKGKTLYLAEFASKEELAAHQVHTTNGPSINEDIDNSSILGNPMKHYLPSVYDKIIWRNVDDPKAPTLTSREIMKKDFRNENFELAIIGEIFDTIVFAHKDYVEKTNDNAKLGKGKKIEYVDSENPSILHIILSCCHIYARVSPSGKMKVVEELIKMGYMTVMCGDGSNDVEALKAAHVGVSLSEAEASIAAPFTSVQNSIRSVVDVIKEGRASLSSSFQMFKYMALYSLFEFFAAVLIFKQNATIGDSQYLYIDMFIILPVVLLMANSKATDTLNKEKPPESLFSRFVLVSLLGQIFWGFALMLGVFLEILFDTVWYKPAPLHKDPKDNIVSFETTITYLACCFAVLNSAVSQSISEPFKRPLLTHNFIYVLLLVILYLFTTYILFEPCHYLKTTFQFISFPMEFKLRLFGYCMAHFVVGYFWEMFLIWRWPVRQPLKAFTIYNMLRLFKAATCTSDKSWFGRFLQKLLQREKRKWKPYKQLRSNLGIQKVRERMSSDKNSKNALQKSYDKASTTDERRSLLA